MNSVEGSSEAIEYNDIEMRQKVYELKKSFQLKEVKLELERIDVKHNIKLSNFPQMTLTLLLG